MALSQEATRTGSSVMDVEKLRNILSEITAINDKQEKRVRYHETKAQNLTIAYLISQCIIFISITHQTLPNQCKNWWIPFSLSLLSSFIYFITFIDDLTMYFRTKYHLELNYLDQQAIHVQLLEATYHKINIVEGGNSQDRLFHHETLKPDQVQLFRRKAFITVILLALLGFAVTMLYACRSFFC